MKPYPVNLRVGTDVLDEVYKEVLKVTIDLTHRPNLRRHVHGVIEQTILTPILIVLRPWP